MIGRLLIAVGAAFVGGSTWLTWYAYEGRGIRNGYGVDDLRLDGTLWETSDVIYDAALVVFAAGAVLAAVVGHRRAVLVAGSSVLVAVPFLAFSLTDESLSFLGARGLSLAATGSLAVVTGLALLTRGDGMRVGGRRRCLPVAAAILTPLVGLLPYLDGAWWFDAFGGQEAVVLAVAAALAAASLAGRSAAACVLGVSLAAMTLLSPLELFAQGEAIDVGAWGFAVVVAPLALVAAANPLDVSSSSG